MRVVANGKEVEVAADATVADLVEHLGLTNRLLLVERNGEPVDRSAVASTGLCDGDRVELVRAVAGG